MMVLRKGVLREEGGGEAQEAPPLPAVFHYTLKDKSHHLVVTRVRRGMAKEVHYLLMWRNKDGARDVWHHFSLEEDIETMKLYFTDWGRATSKGEAWEPFKAWWEGMKAAGRLK